MGEDLGLSLRDTLSLFFRRVYLLYVVVVALPLGVLITCMLVKPVYESTAKVIVTAKRETSALLQYPREMAPQMSFNLNVDETDLNSEMELLRSPELWIRTVKKLGVKTFKTGKTGMIKGWLKHVNEMLGRPLSRKKLQTSAAERESAEIQQIAEGLIKDLKITAVVKSKVLDLSFKYSDPVMAQKILATALALYIPYHMEVYALPGAQKFFSGQSDLYKRKYEEADRDLAEFKKKWGLSLAERQKTELITFIKQIQDALVYVNSDQSQYKIMLAAVKKGYLPSGQLAAGVQRGSENTFINIVSSQLLRAVQKQWQTAEAYQPGSRDYRATADMVTDLTKKYAEALQGELNVVEAKKMSLEQSLKEKEEQLALLEEKSEEARRKQLDVSVAKERYLRYMSKEEEARLENLKGGSQVRDVSVVGKPLTPADPVFPKTFLFVLGAFFLAIPVGMGAILTAHFLDHTFDNPRTLGAHTGYPVLASLGKVQTSKSAAPSGL
jgi:uncharacterized protein involved in exopolysaccharide biosynthesis